MRPVQSVIILFIFCLLLVMAACSHATSNTSSSVPAANPPDTSSSTPAFSPTSTPTPPRPITIGGHLNIGYVGPADINPANISRFTHVIFAEVRLASSSDPTLVMKENIPWSDLSKLATTAHSLGIEAMFSLYIGGNDELGGLIRGGHLATVVANIVHTLTAYDLDGVDIDWESGEPQADMSAFLDVLGPAVHALPGKKIVTAAASWYRFDVSLAEVKAGNIDYVMPMCYDLQGLTIPSNYIDDPGFDISEYNGYVYTTTGAKESYADTVGIMQMWIAGGFPKSKLLPGIQTSETDANTAGDIASWTASQGLGGNMIFMIDGVDGTGIVSAVYDALSTVSVTTPVPTPAALATSPPTLIPDPSTFGLSGGNQTYTESANRIDAMRFQNTVGTGTLTKLDLMFNQAAAAGNVRMGVYADDNGSVGKLLLDAGQVPVETGWTAITGLKLPVTAGSYYWLAFSLSNDNTIEYQSTGEPIGIHVADEDIAYGPLPVTFPVTWSGNTPYVIRATVIK